MSTPTFEIRHKVVVVPYTVHPGTGQELYLLIQDKETRDWSFVTGGKKARESYRESALRELEEETKGVLSFHHTLLREACSFTTSFRPPQQKKSDRAKNIQVRSLYRIYEIPVEFSADLRARFKVIPRTKEDETIDIRFLSREDILFSKHDRIWNFIRKEVAPVYFSL